MLNCLFKMGWHAKADLPVSWKSLCWENCLIICGNKHIILNVKQDCPDKVADLLE